MKNRLILIEGIPGSGKSTIAEKLKDYLVSKGINAKLYSEGDAHPADMAWNAYIKLDEYKELLVSNPEYADIIKVHTKLEEDYALVAYTKLGLSLKEHEIMKYLEEHEVYNGRVGLETFEKLHLKRWEEFAKTTEDDVVVIFECAYLQNHICELMGAHNKDTDYIIDYLIRLIKTVESLNPKLIYLTQADVYETIDRVAKERVSSDKSKWDDWIDLVISYVENSKYGQTRKLKGFEGVMDFLRERKKIELALVERVNIDKAVIENLEYNWDDVFGQVISTLS